MSNFKQAAPKITRGYCVYMTASALSDGSIGGAVVFIILLLIAGAFYPGE